MLMGLLQLSMRRWTEQGSNWNGKCCYQFQLPPHLGRRDSNIRQLNHLTTERRREAATEIKTGMTICLELVFTFF